VKDCSEHQTHSKLLLEESLFPIRPLIVCYFLTLLFSFIDMIVRKQYIESSRSSCYEVVVVVVVVDRFYSNH